MRFASSQSLGIWTAGSVMLILLSLLAVVQYRWLGEVSDAERERMRARMESGAARFAREFDREMTRAVVLLGPQGSQRRERGSTLERRARWTSSALFPELVRAVFVALPGDDGGLRLSRVDEETGALAPVVWPADLAGLKSRLERAGPVPDPAPGSRRSRVATVTTADVPAIVVPYDAGYVVLWLDEEVLERKLLPDLAAKHFSGPAGLDDGLQVLSLADPPRVIYRAGPSTGGGATSRFDVEVDLLGVARTDDGDAPRQWRLCVAHPSGSLEGAVASARHRNLAVAFGTLLSLALGMAALLISTRRAQGLARQQLEFTASVTHELATPLAGMRSAAQNLADGVVRDPERVKEYGSLIEREGRRLTEMVGQVLSFAGMQSGKSALAPRALAIGSVIEEALSASQRSLDESGIRIEKDITPGLPEVSGDGPALTRAFENLIGNAVKYAADGSWIGLRACVAADREGRWLEVTVADRGPGIAAEDLPHIFEAFYRGRGRTAGAVPGSGLGLTLVRNIVQSHGGRVTVETSSGRGTAFKLFLPVAEHGSV